MSDFGASTCARICLWLGSMLLLVAAQLGAQGFPNVAQTPGAVLSGLNAPEQGRTAIIAYHHGILFTVPELPSSEPNSDFQVRTWDLSDPTNPVQLATHGISPMPINAHGYLKSGDYLVIGPNWPPEAPWSFRANGALGNLERTEFPQLQGAGVRGSLFQPWFVGDTYWSYGEVSGDAFIELDGVRLAEWDHLGQTGVVGHPFLLGDLLIFASDQSRTGVATYDVSDPTNPVLLDVLTTGGPGGYWPELWGGDGKLYAVFPYRTGGNGMRVVDLTDPTDLRLIADQPLTGDASMYIQFQDEYAFMGSHKVDMRTFQSVLDLDGANTVRPNDGGTGIETSQFLLPLGNLLVTGGVGPHQGMAVWAHQATPDTRGPSVGYHVPRAGRANYPVGAPISLLIHETLETPSIVNGTTFIVRPLGGSPVAGRLTFAFDDVLTFTPDAPLQANTTYEVVLPAGGIRDAVGNGMVGYSFTFSTGSMVGGNIPPEVSAVTASAYPVAPGGNITLTATASDPEGGALEYRFDFGDGSSATSWSSTASAAHSYVEAGHYQAIAQVRDTQGALATGAVTVTVVAAPPAMGSTRSNPVLCDAGGRRVWTVNPDNDTLTAVDADSLAVVAEVPVCTDPRSVAQAANGELWVACHDADSLWVLDSSGAMLTEIDTGYGSAPIAVLASPDGSTVFATLLGSGELRRYDATTRLGSGALTLGPGARAMTMSGDGSRLLVGRFLSPRNRGEVWQVDPTMLSLVRIVELPKIGGDENRDTTASGKGVANYLVALATSPDGQSTWVAANKPNTERGLLFADDLDQDNTVRNMVLRLEAGGASATGHIDLDNSDSASAAAYSPLGDYLFVTLQGNDQLVVLDALRIDGASGLGSLVTRLGVGAAPQGVCVDPPTRRTFVKNFLGRSLTVLETADLFLRGDKNVASVEVPTVAAEALPVEVLDGKRVFYNAGDPRMSGEGYMSCATCHLDGGQDGRVWDFTGRGEGLRNTTSLRGRGGMDHGNVHWTANFDEIQDFENDIRGAFGGRGFMDDTDFGATSDPLGPAKTGLSAELDALAAYVSSLGSSSVPRSPYRLADGSLTAEALAGREIFAGLQCANCHAGTDFTDSTLGPARLHDVGTLRTSSGGRLGGPLAGIDTPTLAGAWATAPYLHDGSAETLEAVFAVAGGEVLQAESGSTSGGAYVVDTYVDLNNDDTVHERAYAFIDSTGQSLALSGVGGGSGGVGAIELRYSCSQPRSISVVVNGEVHAANLVDTGNAPDWRHTHWQRVRVEGVMLKAGATNTVVVTTHEPFLGMSLDELVVTTADELALAAPHRSALGLSVSDRAALVDYLRQLDGQQVQGPEPVLFGDGFETGNTSRWSATQP